MNVGKISDDGFKVDRTKFRKTRGSEFFDLSVFFNIAGDSDIDQSANVGLNSGTGGIKDSAGVRRVENHGIMTTGEGIVGS